MNLFRSSQPGELPRGRCTKMDQPDNRQRGYPVTLNMDVHPPVLETAPRERPNPKLHPSQGKPQKVGTFWHQLNNMYQSIHKICTTGPVTYVNSEMLGDPCLSSIPYLGPHQYPPITAAHDPNAALWFSAQPQSNQVYLMDPLRDPHMSPLSVLQGKGVNPYQYAGLDHHTLHNKIAPQPNHLPLSNYQTSQNHLPHCKPPMNNHYTPHNRPPMQQNHHTPDIKQPLNNHYTPDKLTLQYNYQAPASYIPTNKPLNPEAKEWVPNNYYNMNGSTSTTYMNKMNERAVFGTEKPSVVIPNDYVNPGTEDDFCEITECEVDAIRQCDNVLKVSKPQTLPSHKVEKEIIKVSNSIMSTMPKCNQSSQKSCSPWVSTDSVNSTGQQTLQVATEDIGVKMKSDVDRSKSSSMNEEAPICNRLTDSDRDSWSYASIARRSPSPITAETDNSQGSSTKFEKVAQPIPKIFVKDSAHLKESVSPSMENKCKIPEFFKSLSKSQKASSKRFLKELKSSPVKCQTNGMGNIQFSMQLSFSSKLPESPPQASFPKDDEAVPSVPVSASHKKMERSLSECSSSSSRTRSASESSTTSVDSLDIQFGEDETDKMTTSDKMKNNGNLKTTSSSDVEKDQKLTNNMLKCNNVLACILGCDDSESESSEDEDNDSDDDWDKVCEKSGDIDDTWETFGFGLVISNTGILPCPQVAVVQSAGKSSSEICDNISELENSAADNYLREVNKRWEEEVENNLGGKNEKQLNWTVKNESMSNIAGKSERRVRFGSVTVHPLVTWRFAHRAARSGPWEQYARDRARFAQRIACLEPELSLVLCPEHRESVYTKMQRNTWPS